MAAVPKICTDFMFGGFIPVVGLVQSQSSVGAIQVHSLATVALNWIKVNN